LDWFLIGFFLFSADFWLNVLYVGGGLGAVIFVHELGHFAVAKFCGVRCDKFYLGFDIAGLKLCKFKWGETEYGIGILPLGGYVKMLGQEDSPTRLRDELEKAKLKEAGQLSEDEESDEPIADVATLEEALYDPRSYLAQSVPKRMAIISAGVIMNLVFAVVAAMIAYTVGVNQIAVGVGTVQPGGAAWKADLQVGDEIVKIGDEEVKEFRKFQSLVSLSKQGEPVRMTVRRYNLEAGKYETFEINIEPDRDGLIPMIGIGNPLSTSLVKTKGLPPALPGSAAFNATPAIESDDTIVEINGQPVENHAALYQLLSRLRDEPIKLTVLREVKNEEPKRVEIDLPVQPIRRVGLVMTLGPVAEVRKGSAADKAGVKTGDKLISIDGQSVGDPITLADRMRSKNGQPIELVFKREDKTIPVSITPKPHKGDDLSFWPNGPVATASLGLAFEVWNRVADVVAGSPAAEASVKPGSVITSATFIPPDSQSVEKLLGKEREKQWKPYLKKSTVPFDGDNRNWPMTFFLLQQTLPGTQLQLIFEDEEEPITLTPVAVAGKSKIDRGLLLGVPKIKSQAESLGQAFSFGCMETWSSSKQIFVLLNRLLTGQMSAKVLGGPLTIIQVASNKASEGLSAYMLFLTLLSANLAVINFLPIPVLDGGHMVFLSYEMVRGKPASENVLIAMSYLGLLFILGLMVWVIGLDFVRLFGGI
jgi:regulator of sigma E protease